jgi:hypothetical protein
MLFSLLDEHIVEGIPAERIQGYEHEVSTHAQVAQDVANGEADAEYKSPRLALVLDYVHTSAFRKTLRTLGGNDPGQTGKDILI